MSDVPPGHVAVTKKPAGRATRPNEITFEGMMAKIRYAQLWGCRSEIDRIVGGCEEAMALSIFSDIQRMAGKATS